MGSRAQTQYCPDNSVEQTEIVRAVLTKTVNLRHFCLPSRQSDPSHDRIMLICDWLGNQATLRGKVRRVMDSPHRADDGGASMSIPAELAITVSGVLAAAVLRGFTGFGFGLAAVPLLSLALPPTQAVPLVVVLQSLVGLAGLRDAWRLCDWRAVRDLAPGLVCGIPVGLAILTTFPPDRVRLAIGLVIAGSVLVLWRGVRLAAIPSRAVTLAVGTLSGVMSGLSSMGGPPIVVYLLALAHSAARVRATSIVYFMLASLVSAAPMTWRGLIDRRVLVWALACLPVLLGGSWLGGWAFARAKPHHHRATALAVLSVLAALLILRALTS
jgi:uncharacterized membrane protein YfcA